jgi:hypothetical protein
MSKELKELHDRKQELLLESEINRQIVALEVKQLQLKATEWRHGLAKAGNVYKWVAPLAGVGFGFFAARRQVHKAETRASRNNRRGRAFNYMSLLGPLGATALKQGLQIWRNVRSRAHSNGHSTE